MFAIVLLSGGARSYTARTSRFESLMVRGAVPDRELRDGWEWWQVQDPDQECEASASWFPAWMLIHESNIVDEMQVTAARIRPQERFAALRELTCGNGKDMDTRRKPRRPQQEMLRVLCRGDDRMGSHRRSAPESSGGETIRKAEKMSHGRLELR